jgi:hypothetical protein
MMLVPKATEADARAYGIPLWYSREKWDPSEEPITLLASVFDANSFGKWTYDWTVYHCGVGTPLVDMAGELWLLLIHLAGKVKRAEGGVTGIGNEDQRGMVFDFIHSGEILMDRLQCLVRACETPMLEAGRHEHRLGEDAGVEFVQTIFGRDRLLGETEKLMASMRLWKVRFDANCGEVLPGASRPSPVGEVEVCPRCGRGGGPS